MKLRCKLQTGKTFEMYKMNRQLLWMVKLMVIFYNQCVYFLKKIHILTERNCFCGSCIKNKLETGMGTSPKIDIGMANKFMKRCSHHESLDKCKLKLQWYTTGFSFSFNQWVKWKRLTILNASEAMKPLDPSCSAGEGVKWCNHFRKLER